MFGCVCNATYVNTLQYCHHNHGLKDCHTIFEITGNEDAMSRWDLEHGTGCQICFATEEFRSE